jgi:hypothetical protein
VIEIFIAFRIHGRKWLTQKIFQFSIEYYVISVGPSVADLNNLEVIVIVG